MTGPLDSEPLNYREPFGQRPPAPDFSREGWRAELRADRVAALTDVLAGVELGDYDRQMIDWLAGWDTPTVGTWVSLILRARAAGDR